MMSAGAGAQARVQAVRPQRLALGTSVPAMAGTDKLGDFHAVPAVSVCREGQSRMADEFCSTNREPALTRMRGFAGSMARVMLPSRRARYPDLTVR
jgi:hypothetical protein